ncbi:hypothetical protein GCM10018965_071960 [Nonomuraea roseola]
MANEVFSSVTEPKSIAPRARTLTSRRVFGSVPIVRYFMLSLPSGPSCPGPEQESGTWSALQVKPGRLTMVR